MSSRSSDINGLSEESAYCLLFQKHPIPMWVYDRETQRFLDVNDAAVRQYGYTRDEFLSMTIRDIRPPEDHRRLEEAFTLPDTVPYREMGIWRHRRKDGSLIEAEIFSTSAACRGRRGRAIVALDVTERRRRERERAEAEAMREAALREHARLLDMAAEAAEQQQRFLRDVLSSVTEGKLHLCASPADLPAPLPVAPGAKPVTLSAATLTDLRRETDAAAEAAGLPLERRTDLLMAVGEAAMNAVVHGGGGLGRLRADLGAQVVQVWIEDTGGGIDLRSLPRATLERGYSSRGSLGHGFWMMLQTCDRIWLLTGPGGTTVVLEQQRTAPAFELF